MSLLLVGILFGSLAAARDVRFKKELVPHELEAVLRAQGFKVVGTRCTGKDDCVLTLEDSERKNPTPFIAAAPNANASELEIEAIEKRLNAGNATLDDLRNAVRLLLKTRHGHHPSATKWKK